MKPSAFLTFCLRRSLPGGLTVGCLALALSGGCLSPSPLQPDGSSHALAALKRNNDTLQRSVLDNGMVLLLREDHSAPLVSIQFWVGSGSIHEEALLGSGLSHALEHMVFKGTPNRKLGDITREINDAGGEINAYTSLDRTVFHADMPASHWTVGLDVLADTLLNASFPKGEWEKERDVILREFAMGRDNPDSVLSKLLWSTAFQVHPYRHPVIGHEDVFKTLTRDDITAFHRRHYSPDNMIAVLVGDFSAPEAREALARAFARAPRRGRAPVFLPPEPRQLSTRFSRQTGPYNVSRLAWAWHTVSLSHPDTPALDLLAEIVGRGRSSRLHRRIVEELQLAHSIEAGSYTPREPGVFIIEATFDPARETELMAAIQAEVDSWLNIPFTPRELAKARRSLLRSELANLRTMHGQASSYASGEFYAGDPRFSETYLRLLDQAAPASLQAVVQRHLRLDNRTLCLLTPAAQPPAVSAPAATPKDSTVPPTRRIPLPNGAVLVTREDHRLPFVNICAVLGGGLLSETPSNNGITRLTADLLTRGTSTRSAASMADTIESLGASITPFSGQNTFGIQAECLTADAPVIMEILADCLIDPGFPPDQLARQREIQRAAIDQQFESPMYHAQKALRNILFPGHPYQLDLLGTPASLAKLDRRAIQDYYARHLTASNLVLSIFGDISIASARSLAVRYANAIPIGPRPPLPPLPAPPLLPVRSKQREPHEQAIFLAGFPGVGVTDRRADALSLIQTAVSGLSSELSMDVREKKGLVYYIGAFQQLGIHPGSFVFYAGTREETVPDVENSIRQELQRLTSTGLSSNELDRARRQIVNESEQGLQDNAGLAMQCAVDERLGLDFTRAFTVRPRFQAITADQIREAASSLLSTNRMAISIVLPRKDSEPAGAKP